MATSAYKRAINYLSTYYLLLRDYVSYLGMKAIPIISGVIASSFLYPLPFAIMAGAVYAMLAGHHASIIRISRWTVEVGVDSAFLCSLFLAVVVLTFRYFANRLALDATTSWQTSLFWRAVNRLPEMARWDTETAIPMPLRLERLGGFFGVIIRSGFLVGRMVAIGLSNFVIAFGALIVLTWLDPMSVGVLIFTALLCLPLYGWVLLETVGVRSQHIRKRPQERALLKQVLQGVVSRSERRIATPRLSRDDEHRFAAGYGLVNAQLQKLNLVNLIIGLHVFLSIAIIYIINGASLSTFVRDKIIFFVVLVFMMKSALSLVLLISRLSRGYANLAALRAYLHPRRKRVQTMPAAPDNAIFAVQARNEEGRCTLRKGDPVFVIMPKASRAFEMLPLSNALEILKMPDETVLRHIVFLDVAELQAIIHDGDVLEDTTIEIVDKKQRLQLPVCHATYERQQLGVVALSLEVWERLARSGKAEDFCRDRIVFVVIAEPARPKPPSPKTLLIVSDCEHIIAVGAFAETWERSAEEAFQRAGREIAIGLDDDEEMA